MCNYCWRKGHLERVCNQKKREANLNSGKPRTIGNRVQIVNQDGTGEDDQDDYMVLNVDGSSDDAKPFYMEGFITILALGTNLEYKLDTEEEKLGVRRLI